MSLIPIFPKTGGAAYAFSSLTEDAATFDTTAGSSLLSGAYSFTWKPDGTRFFVPEGDSGATGRLYYFDCTTAWDIGTAAYAGSIALDGNRLYTVCTFNPAGTQVNVAYGSTNAQRIRTYNLSTAYGGTATYVDQTSVNSVTYTTVNAMWFNADGSRLFWSMNDRIFYDDLSTDYDVSTRSGTTFVAANFGGGSGYNADRTGLRVTAVIGPQLRQWTTSTAFDFTGMPASTPISKTIATPVPSFTAYAGNGRKIHGIGFSGAMKQYSTVG